jgi:predicted RNA-binding protein with PUA-like domain
MNYWLLKTEPSTYSWADLVRAGRAVWDGVKNPAALGHLRGMQPGDQAFVYHTGNEKAVVGVARVVSAAYPDPKAGDPRLVVVNLEAVRPLAVPVTLAAVKADPRFAGFALVRVPRLSVMPVTTAQWETILAMSRES